MSGQLPAKCKSDKHPPSNRYLCSWGVGRKRHRKIVEWGAQPLSR